MNYPGKPWASRPESCLQAARWPELALDPGYIPSPKASSIVAADWKVRAPGLEGCALPGRSLKKTLPFDELIL